MISGISGYLLILPRKSKTYALMLFNIGEERFNTGGKQVRK